MKFKIKYDMEQKLVQKLHYEKAGAFNWKYLCLSCRFDLTSS
jgi:hypothetical protein